MPPVLSSAIEEPAIRDTSDPMAELVPADNNKAPETADELSPVRTTTSPDSSTD